jgi:23S rRNA pseudouridine1911/1915/1917 synthase
LPRRKNNLKKLIYDKENRQRIDQYLKENLGISRNRIKKLINKGKILVNGIVRQPAYNLVKGDIVAVECEIKDISVNPQEFPLEIIYHDACLIVVNKPSCILTHPTDYTFEGTLLNFILFHFSLSGIGAPLRNGVVHRLDRETSGVIIFARTPSAHSNLVEQFKNRTVNKEYLAVVKGTFPPEKKEVEFTIQPDKAKPTKMQVHFLRGKKSLTRIEVDRYIKDRATILKVKPVTGRTHQIRLTLAYLGYPIIGDGKYGVSSPFISRTALHAHKISFIHPEKKETISFRAELPEDIKALIDSLDRQK